LYHPIDLKWSIGNCTRIAATPAVLTGNCHVKQTHSMHMRQNEFNIMIPQPYHMHDFIGASEHAGWEVGQTVDMQYLNTACFLCCTA